LVDAVERRLAAPHAPCRATDLRAAPAADPTAWPDPCGTVPRRPSQPFAFCAAVQPDEQAALDLASAEMAKAPRRLRGLARQLAGSLAVEAEREGTVSPDPLAPARAVARDAALAAVLEPAASFRAAREIQALRDRYRDGLAPIDVQPPRPVPAAVAGAKDGQPANAEAPRPYLRPAVDLSPPPRPTPPAGDDATAVLPLPVTTAATSARLFPAVAPAPPRPEPGRPDEGAIQPVPPALAESEPPLPAWLDEVDARIREMAERLPAHERSPYLVRVARVLGYDSS
jgi:hypothetical protein